MLSKQGHPEHWQTTVEVLKTIVKKLQTGVSEEHRLKMTFLIRSDTCMEEAFGDYAYCAKMSRDFLDELRSKGNEIGWHPHLWRWSGRWIAEQESPEFIRNCLINGFSSLCDYFPVTSVRTGWDFMSNTVMSILESLGIVTDFSAVPGIQYQDLSHGHGCNWLGTPSRFYFPSREDYRLPTTACGFKVLEMPISLTMTPVVVSLIRPFLDVYRKIERTRSPYEPINLAKHPVFTSNGLETAFRACRSGQVSYVLTYFHPYELVGYGLFSMKNLENNVRHIFALSDREKVQVVSMTATEAAHDFLASYQAGRNLSNHWYRKSNHFSD
jgi:hypothetical protein